MSCLMSCLMIVVQDRTTSARRLQLHRARRRHSQCASRSTSKQRRDDTDTRGAHSARRGGHSAVAPCAVGTLSCRQQNRPIDRPSQRLFSRKTTQTGKQTTSRWPDHAMRAADQPIRRHAPVRTAEAPIEASDSSTQCLRACAEGIIDITHDHWLDPGMSISCADLQLADIGQMREVRESGIRHVIVSSRSRVLVNCNERAQAGRDKMHMDILYRKRRIWDPGRAPFDGARERIRRAWMRRGAPRPIIFMKKLNKAAITRPDGSAQIIMLAVAHLRWNDQIENKQCAMCGS